MYKVEWEDKAKENLAKIDRVIAKKLTERVENYLAKDPINRGKPLVGNLKGSYRYRFSEYRVIYKIKPTKLLIVVVEVDHRRKVYL
jgi:mRNA interferase RelE/StbE